MSDEPGSRLCAECGEPLDASSSACTACGARRAPKLAIARAPEGPAVDAAWAGVARATLVFLVVNVGLRLPDVLGGGPRAGRAVALAAVTAAVILGVRRGLARRNAALLVAWSWLVSSGAGVSLGGVALWVLLAPVPAWRLAFAVSAALSAAVYAAWLFAARRAIEGGAAPARPTD